MTLTTRRIPNRQGKSNARRLTYLLVELGEAGDNGYDKVVHFLRAVRVDPQHTIVSQGIPHRTRQHVGVYRTINWFPDCDALLLTAAKVEIGAALQ